MIKHHLWSLAMVLLSLLKAKSGADDRVFMTTYNGPQLPDGCVHAEKLRFDHHQRGFEEFFPGIFPAHEIV